MTSSDRERALERLACVFVTGVLFFNWWNMAQYQVDVPRMDDWRQLTSGPFLRPSALDVSWLFTPSNGTMYATGKLLDYLFFTYGPGNYALSHQISLLTVLGTCLFFIFRLLQRLELVLPWRLFGIVSTVYFLQVGSYWGNRPALAYHQALPVVGILAILFIVTSGRWGPARAASLAAVALASGLAYISGAVAMTALGFTLLVIAGGFRRASVTDSDFADLQAKSLVVLFAGIITFAAQLAIVMRPDGSIPGPPLATPLDWQFWTFFVNQLARASGVPGSGPIAFTLAILLNVMLFGLVFAAMTICAKRIAKGSHRSRDLHYLVIAGGILVPLLGYLAIVSAGRGNFHQHESIAELTRMSKSRFHYWWLAPLLTIAAISPSLISKALTEGGAASSPRATLLRWFLPSLIGVFAFGMPSKNLWDFEGFYRQSAVASNRGVRCLQRGLLRRGPIRCPALNGKLYKIDLRGPVENAIDFGLPFTDALELSTLGRGTFPRHAPPRSREVRSKRSRGKSQAQKRQ